MAHVQTTKSPAVRKSGTRIPGAVHAYTVNGDAATTLAKMRLPQGASIAIIPASAAVEAKLKRAGSGQLTRSRWVVTTVPPKGSAQGAGSTAVGGGAFEPDARARAVLRGVEYARADLRDAGGAYDIAQVRALLHDVSRQAIDKRVKEGSLLAVPGPSNRRRFPTVQFNDEGAVIDGLKEVQETLGYASPWAVLNFLVNPDDRLAGARPIDLLRRGERARVLESARRIGVQGA